MTMELAGNREVDRRVQVTRFRTKYVIYNKFYLI